MELRTCDFRNAKFQGETIGKEPAGFGIVLDQNYTCVISDWDAGNPTGPFATIFDDSNKLYGDLNERDSLLVYSTYQFKAFKSKLSIVIDCFLAKYLLKIEQIPYSSSPKQKIYSKYQPKFRVIAQRKYEQENYVRNLSQMLQRQIPSKYLSYQNYIKETFKTKNRNLLNVLQSSKQFCLSFHQEGITIKMSKKIDRIINVGFTDIDKKYEIGRKYSYFQDETKWVIEEFIETQPSIYIQFERCHENCKDGNSILKNTAKINEKSTNPYRNTNHMENSSIDKNKEDNSTQERPKQCIKNLRQYYKRSLSFVNKYMNLTKIYQLKGQFEVIYRASKQIANGKYPQTQLENNGYKLNPDQTPIITQENQVRPYQYTVDDWKKQIDRTISGRPSGKSTLKTDYKQISIDQSRRQTERRRPSENTTIIFKEKENQIERDYTPKKDKRVERMNPQRENPRPNRSKSQRQLKYLDSESEQENYYGFQGKYENTNTSPLYKDTGSLYKGTERRSPISYKFKYVDQDMKSPQYRYNPEYRAPRQNPYSYSRR